MAGLTSLALLLCVRAAVGAEPGAATLPYPPEPPPGACAPAIEPPARIVQTWLALDAREQPAGIAPPAGPLTDPLTDPAAESLLEPLPDLDEVIAEADRMALVREGVSRLEGNVWLQQGEKFLATEALEFDESNGVVRTLAPARFGTRQLLLDTESAVYDTEAGKGVFKDNEYFLLQRGARGSADVLARTGEGTARLEGVMYTSCPPDDVDWTLKASSMDLDQAEGVGVARNVRIAFMNVPFLYIPWMSFPITEDRKTGFLFPEFGDSGRHGAWLRVPYYLNLAPNYDALITPYYMSERGTMLEGEFRYLFGWGSGTLDAEYIDRDRSYEEDHLASGDPLAGSSRHYYRLRHRSLLPADWVFGVNYQQVSDPEYFQDFGQGGSGALVSFLTQSAGVSKSTLEYGASLGLLRYQTVNPTLPERSQPYEKWPEFDYYWSPLPFDNWLWVNVDGESVNFQHDDRLSGWRHHAETAFSADFGDPGLRLTPHLGWWQTRYDVETLDGSELGFDRGVPFATLDAVARFSRPLGNGGRQTLEPRLFYAYVPYRDQSAFPVFDTRAAGETVMTLFQRSRFTGPDRIGDLNRITLGVDSSLVRSDGREWLTGRIARAWYLDDRRVQLGADATPQTRDASDYYAALEYVPSERHSTRLDLGWNPEDREYSFIAAQYQYQPSPLSVLNLSYRYRRAASATADPTRQADVSFVTPLGGRWSVFGRAVYDIEDERSQETLAGFEYETCCWVFRTFSQRYIMNREGEMDRAIWFQLELKGLSSVGRRIDEFLTENIYGYGETP